MPEAHVADGAASRGSPSEGASQDESQDAPAPEHEKQAPVDPSPERLVDPSVSRAKFEREVRQYRAQEATYRKRGWFLVRAEFPEVLVLMSSPHVQPWGIQYALLLDFTDYDLLPPSVKFVDPFTLDPLPLNAVLALWQKRERPGGGGGDPNDVNLENGAGPAPEAQAAPVQLVQPLNLVQGHPDRPAFLCVQGTREYHAHPYHSNDPWGAHRGKGPGSLFYLLDVIWRHGILPFGGYQIHASLRPHWNGERVP